MLGTWGQRKKHVRSLEPLMNVGIVLFNSLNFHVYCADVFCLHLSNHFADIILSSFENSDKGTMPSWAVWTQRANWVIVSKHIIPIQGSHVRRDVRIKFGKPLAARAKYAEGSFSQTCARE